MRMLLFFDLPMVTRAEKKKYAQFRRFLLNDGYDMIQWSVYGRLLAGMDDEQKHLRRLIDNLPPEGNVRCMTVTEKQFAGIKLLVGPPRFVEKRDSASQLLLF